MPDDIIVASKHHLHPLVTQPLGHLGGAVNVAKQDGYSTIWSSMGTQVGLLRLYRCCNVIDGGPDVH